jgi:hypothetical protein
LGLFFEVVFLKIGVLAVFFADFHRNPCFWANNRGQYVKMRRMGKTGKYKTSKREHTVTRNEQKGIRNARLLGINSYKINTFNKLTFC